MAKNAVLSIDEDVALYQIFSDCPEGAESGAWLEEKRTDYLAVLGPLLVDYIWQNEPFVLRVAPASGGVPAHLVGSTNYGENVDDEWFIVYLLLELTKRFTDVIARIKDSDGEFLLIEAADSLPKWLNPDTAENRIYLHQGAVHVVPRPAGSAELADNPAGAPTVSQALAYIRRQSGATVASNKVQQDISARVNEYPEKGTRSLHRAHCYIPAGLSAVLDRDPSLIAPVVRAFYLRDQLDLKACVTFKHFRPGTRVLRMVRFTRCLYAQLSQQRFQPDRRSGYSVPAPSACKHAAYDLGMKLAHGAEILCCKYDTAAGVGAGTQADGAADRVVRTDPRWQQFVAKLANVGYFRSSVRTIGTWLFNWSVLLKGELEGSKLYRELLESAEKFYLQSCCSSVPTEQRTKGDDVGRRILSLLKSTTFDMEQMRQMEKSLPPPDDNGWLELTPAQLDDMMNKMSGGGRGGVKVQGGPELDLDQLARSMEAFVDNVSSHEGAEFPREDEIQFDPNSFMQTMQKMFEFEEDPHSGSSSEMDEYESEEELGDAPGSTTNLRHKAPAARRGGGQGAAGHLPPRGGGKNPGGAARGDEAGKYLDMKDYIDAMDRELAKTTVGKSFVREGDEEMILEGSQPPKPPPRKKKQPQKKHSNPSPAGKPDLAPKPASSRQRAPVVDLDDDIDDEDDDFRPVNVDLNAVKNLLDSYQAQAGAAGPATNILGSMGVVLPPPGGASATGGGSVKGGKKKASKATFDDMDDDF